MDDKGQSLPEEMLFRVMKVAEILAKSADIPKDLVKQRPIQNNSTSKLNDGSALNSQKTRS